MAMSTTMMLVDRQKDERETEREREHAKQDANRSGQKSLPLTNSTRKEE